MDHDERDPLLVHLGRTVRALRDQRGWSRKALAARSRISERFLADVESGDANLSLLKLAMLAKAFEVSLVQLFAAFAPPAGGVGRTHVALLGLRGAGKSTVGPLLATALGVAFVELDAHIEHAAGLQLGEIFAVHGESYYREAERTALEQLFAASTASVIAVGGGVVTAAASFALVRAHATTVWLRARPEDHWQRVLAQGDTRPMAGRERAFTDLGRILTEREPLYRQADLTVETSGRTIESVVAELTTRLRKNDSSGIR